MCTVQPVVLWCGLASLAWSVSKAACCCRLRLRCRCQGDAEGMPTQPGETTGPQIRSLPPSLPACIIYASAGAALAAVTMPCQTQQGVRLRLAGREWGSGGTARLRRQNRPSAPSEMPTRFSTPRSGPGGSGPARGIMSMPAGCPALRERRQ